MKRLKPYKDIIWDIVKADSRVIEPARIDVGDIVARTADGKYYYFALGKDNTLLFMLDGGVSENYLDAYNVGLVKDEALDKLKEALKGKFCICR